MKKKPALRELLKT